MHRGSEAETRRPCAVRSLSPPHSALKKVEFGDSELTPRYLQCSNGFTVSQDAVVLHVNSRLQQPKTC